MQIFENEPVALMKKKSGNVKNGKKSKKFRKLGGVWEFIAFRK